MCAFWTQPSWLISAPALQRKESFLGKITTIIVREVDKRNFFLIFDVGYFDTSLKSKAITFFSFGGDLKFIAFTSMASSIS